MTDPEIAIFEILRKLRLVGENLPSVRDLPWLDAELGRLLTELGVDSGGLGYDPRSYLYLVLPQYLLDQPIAEFSGISSRTKKLLSERIIETLEDLLEHSETELLRQRGFGDERLGEVTAFLDMFEEVSLHLSAHDDRRPEEPPGDKWVRMSAGTEHDRWVLRSRLLRAAVYDLEELPYPDYRFLRHLAQRLEITRVGQLISTGRTRLLAMDWADLGPVLVHMGEPDADPAHYAVERLEHLLSRYGLAFP